MFIPRVGQLAMVDNKLVTIYSVHTKFVPKFKRTGWKKKEQIGEEEELVKVLWRIVGQQYPDGIGLTHPFSHIYDWEKEIMKATLLRTQFECYFNELKQSNIQNVVR